MGTQVNPHSAPSTSDQGGSNPTASSTTSQPSTSSSSTQNPGTTAKIIIGEAAGIAVGTFLVGLILGLLAFWFFMKHRKRSSHDRRSGTRRTSDHGEGRHGDKDVAILGGSEAKPDDTLLDLADTSTLKTTMAQMNDFIDQHVENHYHEEPVNITEAQLAGAISECVMSNPASGGVTPGDLARLLRASATRFAAIRHFIASVIFSNTQLDAPPDANLLPSYIVSLYKAFPPVERQAGCDEAFENALIKWKHLSAYLLVPNRSCREDLKLDERSITPAAELNVRIIKHVLAPFMVADPKNSADYDKNLRAIIFRGAELGLLLWSQPSAWVFEWGAHPSEGDRRGTEKSRSNPQGRLVVFPALLEKVRGRTNLRRVCDVVVA